MADEEYLISKILSNIQTDPPVAKAWMLFTKSTFPQSFSVLFQCYKMECDEKNLMESAHCLSDLIKKFPYETFLIKELRAIASALCSESNDFLRKIFEQLPEDIKYEVMLAVTSKASSVEEHCELMLLFLKRMPNARLLQHGTNIIDTLLAAEVNGIPSGVQIPINLFRKMLVCDALPLILKVSQFEYKFKVIFQLLQKSVEFYIGCMFAYPTAQDAAIRKEIFSSSDNPDENWKLLLKLFEIVATRYKWNYPEMFVSNFSELSLQQLLSLLKRKNKLLSFLVSDKHRREETSGFEEAYFCLVIIFFYYLYNFGRLMHPKMYSSALIGPFNYLLMEGISFSSDFSQKQNYKQSERGFFIISKTASPEASNMLIPSFVTAVDCWELLHRHQHLLKEFNSLCSTIKLKTWPVFQEFFINTLIYSKNHREAIEHLLRIKNVSMDPSHKYKASLQLASCYHYVGEYENAVTILFDVVMNLPSTSPETTVKTPLSKYNERFLYFMGYNNSEILQFTVQMLLKLYKCREKIDESYKDMILGHKLVLMQYDLEHEYDLLNKCIDSIKKAKSFCFPKFFSYIINVDILEEISYLATPAGGNVNLEILSTPTFQATKQRAVTRGVNKGARDDLKQAFINQMARCYDNLDNLFIDFIKKEHTFLLLSLAENI